MIKPLTITCPVAFQPPPPEPTQKMPSGRVPRLTRLLALAMRLERLVRDGTVAGYAELARLGQVSPARISQIVALVNLAPDIQEEILFWPRVQEGRASILLRDLQPIAQVYCWRQQRRLWRTLKRRRGLETMQGMIDVSI